MSHPVDTIEYWVQDFSPSADELEALYEYTLEGAKPVELETLAAEAIRIRIRTLQEAQQSAKGKGGVVYRPNDKYEKGQKLNFPLLDDATGVVDGVREGNNPDYGDYQVIQVKIDGDVREFAADFEGPHRLIGPEIDVDPDAIASRFASLVAPSLASHLASDKDWVHYGDRWVLKGLLPEIHMGHHNLAEAIIMVNGDPLPTSDIVPELELETEVPEDTQEFAVMLSLAQDERFRNVGALESPLWALTSQIER